MNPRFRPVMCLEFTNLFRGNHSSSTYGFSMPTVLIPNDQISDQLMINCVMKFLNALAQPGRSDVSQLTSFGIDVSAKVSNRVPSALPSMNDGSRQWGRRCYVGPVV